jgi:putative flippase GtrA
LISSLIQRRGVRQLVKFCLVGTSSAIVDKTVYYFLQNAFRFLPWWLCQTVSFCFGLTNGFFWNRHLTFRAHSYGSARSQYTKFAITNTVGLILNLVITKIFLMFFTGQVVHGENPETRIVMIAGICAIPFVAIWNFSAAKYWTFREPKAGPEDAPSGPPATKVV